MGYKLLYIEDLNPGSILHELKIKGFEVKHLNPNNFEETITEITSGGYHAILIDFRLTSGNALFDGPTIAQTLRTKNSKHSLFIPIFLISSEDVISDYYQDFSSHDLFDFSISKEELLRNMEKYTKRFISFINAYSSIEKHSYKLGSSLNISDEKLLMLDYRIQENLNHDSIKNDVFAYSRFLHKEVIRSIGVLIGEDVLSARLGVSIKSEDWPTLKEALNFSKYTGIFSDSYERWWASELEVWWDNVSGNCGRLRSLNAFGRTEMIINLTGLKNLTAIEKSKYSKSSNFWTICKATCKAIDPIDGLELYRKELYPWQEKEYISIEAGLESHRLYEYVKPIDKNRLKEIARSI